MAKQWTEFNRALTRGKAFNYGPDSHYSWSETSLANQTVIVAYQPTVLKPQLLNKSSMIINGTHQNNLVFDLSKDFGARKIAVYTCTGDLVRKETVRFKGLVKIKVPGSGIVRVD